MILYHIKNYGTQQKLDIFYGFFPSCKRAAHYYIKKKKKKVKSGPSNKPVRAAHYYIKKKKKVNSP
jgi:hypothetical protein